MVFDHKLYDVSFRPGAILEDSRFSSNKQTFFLPGQPHIQACCCCGVHNVHYALEAPAPMNCGTSQVVDMCVGPMTDTMCGLLSCVPAGGQQCAWQCQGCRQQYQGRCRQGIRQGHRCVQLCVVNYVSSYLRVFQVCTPTTASLQ